MKEHQLRQLVTELLEAAQHPEIVTIENKDNNTENFHPSCVKATFENGSQAIFMIQPEDGWPKMETLAEKKAKRRY